MLDDKEYNIRLYDHGHINDREGFPWETILGKTVVQTEGTEGDEEMSLLFEDGTALVMAHYHTCCEDIRVEEVIGDVEDLVGNPLLMAESVSENDWTFYKFATIKGSVTVRWLCDPGSGYYGDEPDVYFYTPKKKELTAND